MKSEVAEPEVRPAGRKTVDQFLPCESGTRPARSIASLLRTRLVILPLLLLLSVSLPGATAVDTALLASLLIAMACLFLANKTGRLLTTTVELVAILIAYAIIATLIRTGCPDTPRA